MNQSQFQRRKSRRRLSIYSRSRCGTIEKLRANLYVQLRQKYSRQWRLHSSLFDVKQAYEYARKMETAIKFREALIFQRQESQKRQQWKIRSSMDAANHEESLQTLFDSAFNLFPEMKYALGHRDVNFCGDASPAAKVARLRACEQKFTQLLLTLHVERRMRLKIERKGQEDDHDKGQNLSSLETFFQSLTSNTYFALALLYSPDCLDLGDEMFFRYAQLSLLNCGPKIIIANEERRQQHDTEIMTRCVASMLFNRQIQLLSELSTNQSNKSTKVSVKAIARKEKQRINLEEECKKEDLFEQLLSSLLLEAFAVHDKVSDVHSFARQVFGRFCRAKQEIEIAVTDKMTSTATITKHKCDLTDFAETNSEVESKPKSNFFDAITLDEFSGKISARYTIAPDDLILSEPLLIYVPPSKKLNCYICRKCHRRRQSSNLICGIDCAIAQTSSLEANFVNDPQISASSNTNNKVAALAYELISNEAAAKCFAKIRANLLRDTLKIDDDQHIPFKIDRLLDTIQLTAILNADFDSISDESQREEHLIDLYKTLFVIGERLTLKMPLIDLEMSSSDGKYAKTRRCGFGFGVIGAHFCGTLSPHANIARRFDSTKGVIEYRAIRSIEAGDKLLIDVSIPD